MRRTHGSCQAGTAGKHGSPLSTTATNLQNNHQSEPSEIVLNGSPTTVELKKKTTTV